MKILSHIRSKSRLKNGAEAHVYDYAPPTPPPYGRPSPSPASKLPLKLIEAILVQVCPHTRDEAYSACEHSGTDGACMLCDMRDLAHCALVSRRWAQVAQTLLYHSVRIDTVHYCELEIYLSAKRKRKSFFDRNGTPENTPVVRLQLLSRTVRENEVLAVRVQYLKIPYMAREECKVDLARIVSVLPNLRFVDLPEGLYDDDPSCHTLKRELQSRCPDIRKMKYRKGAERSFARLAQSRLWQNLEDIELSLLEVDPNTLRFVFANFPALHRAELLGLSLIDDNAFRPNPSLPPFPALVSLSLENIRNVTVDGIKVYLSRPEACGILTSLSLVNTGVLPSTLHEVLATAPHLKFVRISETVSHSFPPSPIPLLKSRSLQVLHYEILSSTTAPHVLQLPSETYYTYLSASLLARNLPSLSSVYALSPALPSLLIPPPIAPFANAEYNTFHQPFSSSKPPSYPHLSRPLNVYTKSDPDIEWNYTLITPPTSQNRRASASVTRPISEYQNAQLGPAWGGPSRESVLVGNGFGGFLAVPTDEARPGTAGGGNRRHSKGEAWMG